MTDTKKQKIHDIFDQAFPEDPAWNKWFFDEVYDDAEAMILDKEGNAVSSLLVNPYTFKYFGSDFRLAYISGVATTRGQRGKGYMHELMTEALHQIAEREYAMAAVVPATDHLYFFYDRFGFATVVYVDCERYTSLHSFVTEPRFVPVEPTAADLRRLEGERAIGVLHDDRQVRQILYDNMHERGCAVAVADTTTVTDTNEVPRTVAIAFAVPSDHDEAVTVRSLWAEDEYAAEAVLALVRERFSDRHFEVWAQPVNPRVRLRARAMLRIIDVGKVLTATAAADRKAYQVIRVHDALIPANNGVFFIKDGKCTRSDSTMRSLTLDVDISVLTTILFSDPKIGKIFGIPTDRPALPLMLD